MLGNFVHLKCRLHTVTTDHPTCVRTRSPMRQPCRLASQTVASSSIWPMRWIHPRISARTVHGSSTSRITNMVLCFQYYQNIDTFATKAAYFNGWKQGKMPESKAQGIDSSKVMEDRKTLFPNWNMCRGWKLVTGIGSRGEREGKEGFEIRFQSQPVTDSCYLCKLIRLIATGHG
jgi:hypothetical protein